MDDYDITPDPPNDDKEPIELPSPPITGPSPDDVDISSQETPAPFANEGLTLSFALSFTELSTPSCYEDLFAESSDDSVSKLFGDPEGDSVVWYQQETSDTCAVVAQGFIIELFDKHYPEHQLAETAEQLGYYTPGVGTFPDDVGRLLEYHNIPVERTHGNSIDDIKEKLQNNQKIIVGIDSDEIWYPSLLHEPMDILVGPQANHAVMVIGYDDVSQEVILNDPGHPAGGGKKVPLDRFEEAWADSSNFMMFTLDAAPKVIA